MGTTSLGSSSSAHPTLWSWSHPPHTHTHTQQSRSDFRSSGMSRWDSGLNVHRVSLLTRLPGRAPDLGLQLWVSVKQRPTGVQGRARVSFLKQTQVPRATEKQHTGATESNHAHRGRPSPLTPSSSCARSRLPPPQSLGRAELPRDQENVAETRDNPTTP